jgi:hypothetical protein
MILRDEMSDQIAVLKHIAEFAATLRGHALGNWQDQDALSSVHCGRCGRELYVVRTLFQPHMEGAALDTECRPVARPVAA